MKDGIEAMTMASLSLALDAAAQRHRIVAHNIANADVEGFVPMQATFSESMEEARRTLNEGRRLSPAQLVAWADEGMRLEPRTDGGLPGRVQLDSEVAQMAQNAVHYQALLKGLNRHMAVMASAVSEGKR
jgi:flagellar basal-body rod protein FlgB